MRGFASLRKEAGLFLAGVNILTYSTLEIPAFSLHQKAKTKPPLNPKQQRQLQQYDLMVGNRTVVF